MNSRPLYIPIMKSKAGERWALDGLKPDSKSAITPLIEFHKPGRPKKDQDPKPLAAHVAGVCAALAQTWGTSQTFYLDTKLFGVEGAQSVSATSTILSAARESGLQFIPVLGPERSAAYTDAIKQAIDHFGRGAMIRAYHTEVNAGFSATLASLQQRMGIERSSIDFLLDYRSADLDLGVHLPRIPAHSDWRTLAVAGGPFPASLNDRVRNEWFLIPREEWGQWRSQTESDSVPVCLVFGDYLTRHCGPPAAGGEPSVNLRYTIDDDWLIWVGGKVKEGASTEMFDVCHSLVARHEFSGAGFSAGDDEIVLRAEQAGKQPNERECGPGGPKEWAMWGMSHHLEFVVNQLAVTAA